MRRLVLPMTLALGLAALTVSCSSSSGGDDSGATAGATTTTRPVFTGLVASEISFHPVTQIVACNGGDPLGEASTTTVVDDTVPALDGTLCYVLGAEAGNGTDVADAKVYADGVGIEVVVRDGSVDTLNELFNACFEATDTCPASSSAGRGYVAIVVDGRVISTPAIEAADLASSPFVITGDFDKAQATNIAAAING